MIIVRTQTAAGLVELPHRNRFLAFHLVSEVTGPTPPSFITGGPLQRKGTL